MELKVYTTNKQPEDIAPFAMIPAFVWTLFDTGKLNLKELMLFTVLYRKVNPFSGKGTASYKRICTWMRLNPSDKNANLVNKMIAKLRDELQLVYFPEHKGLPDFEYVLADFQRGKKDKNEAPDWVDIKQYFQTSNQKMDIGVAEVYQEPVQRQEAVIQRSESPKDAEVKSIGEILSRPEIIPPYTNTD